MKIALYQAIILIGVALSFVLIQDFYPFFRFGMFAEPLQPSQKIEYFKIFWKNQQQEILPFDANQEGLGEDRFAYILRNYYYRNESLALLKILHNKSSHRQQVRCWYFVRYQKIIHQKNTDSTIVQQWKITD